MTALSRAHLFVFALLLALATQLPAQTWQMQNTGFNYILKDICFPGNQDLIGYAVGTSSTYNGNGIILKTTNGGATWSQLNSSTIPGLESLSFVSTDTGYIGGWQNYFAKTTNGGLTWVTSTVNSTIWYIKQVRFRDAMNGFVADQGGPGYVTANGGLTWTAATGFINAEQVRYVTDSVLYAVGGDEKIARSVNKGNSWTTVYTGVFQELFFGVDFYNLDNGIVTGEDGKVMLTTNGGATWTTHYVGGNPILRTAKMFSPSNMIVAGTPEAVYVSTNAGQNWTPDYAGTNTFALYQITYTPNGNGFICGSQGRILKKLAPIVASFTSSTDSICPGDSVLFTNTSTGNPTSFMWTFAGGNPSSYTGIQPPYITFSNPGAHAVQLTIANGSQTDTSAQAIHAVSVNPTISGSAQVIEQTQHTYSTAATNSTFNWGILGGTISSGNGTPQISVVWGQAGSGSLWVDVQHPLGCIGSDTLAVTIASSFGLDETEASLVHIYPIPASQKLFVHYPSGRFLEATYQLIDPTGRLVKTGLLSPQIDISMLAAGTYFLKISTGGKAFMQKIAIY